jgi:N-acetylneuraminate synthase
VNKLHQLLHTTSDIVSIAEIGINHDGDFLVAKQLILDAKWSGATAIKFQYRNLDNVYLGDLKEIGDEIVSSEIRRNYLGPDLILDLTDFAKSLDLLVGISFFVVEDVADFDLELKRFDFFKVPSAEMLNFDLIDELLLQNVEVLISTGAHDEAQIVKMLNRYKSKSIIPMHCVSNYPTMSFNSKIGYVRHLSRIWGGPVGYSSHDEDWKIAIVALSFGARLVERHLTLAKDSVGLDHSTSSTKEEFREFADFAKDFSKVTLGDGPRYPNQGELINLQNLGRSFFAKGRIAAGTKIAESDFFYRAPRTGIAVDVFRDLEGKTLLKELAPGNVLTHSHVSPTVKLETKSVETAVDLEIALPVRLHDFQEIHDKFKLAHYELHLSYEEVARLVDFSFIPKLKGLSVHLPDYVSPNQLIDPFSEDLEIRAKSGAIISKLSEVIQKEQEKRGIRIPLVGSFSVGAQKDVFYENHFGLQDSLRGSGIELLFQWLPPFAWYFGGATKLYAFNEPSTVAVLAENTREICLDISHFKLGVEYWGAPLHDLFDRLLDISTHFHISDAAGFDGEGLPFGEGSGDIGIYLDKIMEKTGTKVIEVWQGHLNDYAGFIDAINYIGSNYGK